jgi:Zn-dependent protease with chaperone function
MMDLSEFFNSWPGMYLAQSFLHSLTAALLVDTALLAWRIEAPAVRQRFRLIVIIVPIISFPLYQFLTPERGSPSFRLDALFDINRWLNLELWGRVPAGFLFLLLLGFAAAVFVVQEMLPIVRHTFTVNEESFEARTPEEGSPVSRALAELPGEKPGVFIIDDDEFVLFSSTGRRPAVYLSTGLLRALSIEEIKASLAHEIGHIGRGRRPLMVLVFLLRMVMFYNPVALMEFRRIVQEEEKICDDVAVSLTGGGAALAGALRNFYYDDDEHHHAGMDTRGLRDRIEEYSHGMLIESRITRLEEGGTGQSSGGTVPFAVTLATVLAVNYYLV